MDENNETFFLLRMENNFDTSFDNLEEATETLYSCVDAGISEGGIIYEVKRTVVTYGDIADL